jgi:hypothetical protein
MGGSSRAKKDKKTRQANNERIIRLFFDKTTPAERGMLAALWSFAEDDQFGKGEKTFTEDLGVDIGRQMLRLPPMESVRICNMMRDAGVLAELPREGMTRVFRFTQKGAAFGLMMQQAQEKEQADADRKVVMDAKEKADLLVSRSKESPDAAAELLERFVFMDGQLAERVIPKDADLMFVHALIEAADTGKYDPESDLVKKARATLEGVRAQAEMNAKKEAEAHGASNG